MTRYRDIRGFVEVLERRGRLVRFAQEICKDTELMPLFRLQLRGLPERARKVMVFENVVGAQGQRYATGVLAGIYGVSDDLLPLGVGCESRREVLETYHRALESPVPPTVIASAPVHEVVRLESDLTSSGLDEIPVPVEDPGFSQIIRTGMPVITQDAVTGIRNIGTYNGFFRDRNRMVLSIALTGHARRHHLRTAKVRHEELPVAVVIGATTNVMLVSGARIPYGIDELAVAGGLVGEPVELVRCKTVPLEVPAHAEIVIEGYLSTEVFEPRLAFSEYTGYLSMAEEPQPVMRVTAITMRRDALFTPIQVGFPPTDHNALWGLCNAALLYHDLRYKSGFPVMDVYCPQTGGGHDFCVIQLENGAECDVASLLHAAADSYVLTKYFMVVDHDIAPQNPDLIFWALNYRVNPGRDIAMIPGRVPLLDPSVLHSRRVDRDEAGGDPRDEEHLRVLINATTKGPYPSLGLPARRFMERALEIWREQDDLPELDLVNPWHGYSMGLWTDEHQKIADTIAAGDYKAVGEITARLQRRV